MTLHEVDGPAVVVVGDCLLALDAEGRATGLCLDEAAPVIEDLLETARPGGAGLAALLAARERPTVLVTSLGADPAGQRVRELLAPGVTLVDRGAEHTVVKTRVRASGRTIARRDRLSAGAAEQQPCEPDLFACAAAVLVGVECWS